MKLLRSTLLMTCLTAMIASTVGCEQPTKEMAMPKAVAREAKLPPQAVKMTSETDDHPPLIEADICAAYEK